MIPKLKAELVTARNCVEGYKKLYKQTGYDLYNDLCDWALETQEETQTVLTELENQILV